MSTPLVGELPGFASIQDADVCNWFFFMFVVATVGFAFYLVRILMKVGFANVPVYAKVLVLLIALATTAVAITNAGFQYTLCRRALSL
jgi:hypothetical protein